MTSEVASEFDVGSVLVLQRMTDNKLQEIYFARLCKVGTHGWLHLYGLHTRSITQLEMGLQVRPGIPDDSTYIAVPSKNCYMVGIVPFAISYYSANQIYCFRNTKIPG